MTIPKTTDNHRNKLHASVELKPTRTQPEFCRQAGQLRIECFRRSRRPDQAENADALDRLGLPTWTRRDDSPLFVHAATGVIGLELYRCSGRWYSWWRMSMPWFCIGKAYNFRKWLLHFLDYSLIDTNTQSWYMTCIDTAIERSGAQCADGAEYANATDQHALTI